MRVCVRGGNADPLYVRPLVFAVARAVQAINGWAGALPNALGEYVRQFEAQTSHTLGVSHRCPKLHVDAVNQMLVGVKARFPSLTIASASTLVAKPTASEGYVARNATFLSDKIISNGNQVKHTVSSAACVLRTDLM